MVIVGTDCCIEGIVGAAEGGGKAGFIWGGVAERCGLGGVGAGAVGGIVTGAAAGGLGVQTPFTGDTVLPLFNESGGWCLGGGTQPGSSSESTKKKLIKK